MVTLRQLVALVSIVAIQSTAHANNFSLKASIGVGSWSQGITSNTDLSSPDNVVTELDESETPLMLSLAIDRKLSDKSSLGMSFDYLNGSENGLARVKLVNWNYKISERFSTNLFWGFSRYDRDTKANGYMPGFGLEYHWNSQWSVGFEWSASETDTDNVADHLNLPQVKTTHTASLLYISRRW